MPEELWKWSATETAAAVVAKQVKPSEVVESVLARIDEQNPHLNAITFDRSADARAAAEAADDLVASGAPLGPLHGVPVTIKENTDVAGAPNPNGIPALAGNIAAEDAPLVRHLKNAGAIIVGHTNTPEFSMRGTTDNPLRGRTFNPWDDDCSPGGSSGGAGSAAASGMGPIHHGNDIGGSLRFPSFGNGVTTVKPSSFRVAAFNASSPSERSVLAATMSVQGIIARHAADVRLATEVLIQPDPRDPNHNPLPFRGPTLDGQQTVAVTTASGGYDIHPGIIELIDRAEAQLAAAGYKTVRVDPPPIEAAAAEWFRAGSTELKANLSDLIASVGSSDIQQVFEHYFELSELLDFDGYLRALADRAKFTRAWSLFLDEYPLLLCPFLMRPMFDWDYDLQGLDAIRDLFASAVYSTGINFLGLPSGVIGMDLVEGRPAAVQIVGRRYREDLICDALEAIEAANGVLAHRLWDRDQS